MFVNGNCTLQYPQVGGWFLDSSNMCPLLFAVCHLGDACPVSCVVKERGAVVAAQWSLPWMGQTTSGHIRGKVARPSAAVSDSGHSTQELSG
jgi:hypothetical protein